MSKTVSKYYGINDIATQWEVKSLVEEKIGNIEFEEWIENIIKSPITTIEEYISNLNVKVFLQYRELIQYLNSEDYKKILKEFYNRISNLQTIGEVDIKLIKYINKHIQEILDIDDKSLKAETLLFILEKRGFTGWKIVINDKDSVEYLFNHFDKTHMILKKVSKDLHYKFIRRILFPLKIHCGLEKQLEIVSLIKSVYKDIANEYEDLVMEYIDGSEFHKLHCYDRKSIASKIVDSRCLSSQKEILLNSKLSQINKECDEEINCNGKAIVISSERYMSQIENTYDFREKIFLLLYEQGVSLFHVMMIESEETSLFDLISYNGNIKNKYKNSTLRKISYLKSNIIVNTLSLIKSYEVEFWSELTELIDEVIKITNISDFLKGDINSIRFLIDSEKFFIAGTLITQIIERLLRELYFKVEYDTVGILKSSNFTLKSFLEEDEEKNPLSKLFQIKELEALSFFLNDRENGKNLRNNLAHYLIDSNELNEIDVIFLLDILIFILLKVDYQGVVFENTD